MSHHYGILGIHPPPPKKSHSCTACFCEFSMVPKSHTCWFIHKIHQTKLKERLRFVECFHRALKSIQVVEGSWISWWVETHYNGHLLVFSLKHLLWKVGLWETICQSWQSCSSHLHFSTLLTWRTLILCKFNVIEEVTMTMKVKYIN